MPQVVLGPYAKYVRRYKKHPAVAIQKLFRGYLGRKKAAARAKKVYSRYAGGRAGYKMSLRSGKYSRYGKARGKRSAYY